MTGTAVWAVREDGKLLSNHVERAALEQLQRLSRVDLNRSRYALGEMPNSLTNTRRRVSALPKPAVAPNPQRSVLRRAPNARCRFGSFRRSGRGSCRVRLGTALSIDGYSEMPAPQAFSPCDLRRGSQRSPRELTQLRSARSLRFDESRKL